MVFNSLLFVLAFAMVLAWHRWAPGWRLKKAGLLVASYLFYAGWVPAYVLLLAFSTAVDWTAAQRMHRASRAGTRRWWLLVSLCANLGLLAVFKYAAFAIRSLTELLAVAGFEAMWVAPDWVLPVGISFFTFQTMSYTIDVYRARIEPAESLLDFALYVSFFPQLVAGPIVRASEFLPQLREFPRPTVRQVGWGISLLIIGLFEKLVLADSYFAPVSDLVFDEATGTHHPGFVAAWAGTLAFAGQIFCDFAGYSTCAIGAALCLGFRIPRNFHFPYAAVGFSDFWRRWHISLSSWLRDYLYIPLGGNRGGQAKTLRNLALTMLLGGLWHGAAWTFVFWGALHGAYLIVERALQRRFGAMRGAGLHALAGLATFVGVCFAWVFFRARTWERAWGVGGALFGLGEGNGSPLAGQARSAWVAVGLMAVLLLVHARLRRTTLEALAQRLPGWLWGVLLGGLLVCICLSRGGDRAFIYFQF